jgi:hypothetical protein
VFDVFRELLTTEHDFKTVIVDSLDGLEPLVWRSTCARNGSDTIDIQSRRVLLPRFGKGYVAADTEWNDYHPQPCKRADARRRCIVVKFCTVRRRHSKIPLARSRIPYSRYQPKLHKRAMDALVREIADVHGVHVNYVARRSIKSRRESRAKRKA